MMAKAKYRNRLGIFASIIQSIKDEQNQARIGAISRRANLSYYSSIEALQQLIKAGMVEEVNGTVQLSEHTMSRKIEVKYWKLTPYGNEVFNLLQDLNHKLVGIGGIFGSS